MNVYTSADKDIQFGGLLDTFYQATCCPRMDFSRPFVPIHDSVTDYKTTGFIYGEDYQSVRQIIHRYTAVKPVNATFTGPNLNIYPGTGAVSLKGFNGLTLFGLLYRFYRGEIRYKVVHQTSNAANSAFYVTDGAYIYAGSSISSTTNPVNEIAIPHYKRELILDTSSADSRVLTNNGANSETMAMYAAGDDFSFSFIHPPPPGTFSTYPLTGSGYVFAGNQGLSNFLAGGIP